MSCGEQGFSAGRLGLRGCLGRPEPLLAVTAAGRDVLPASGVEATCALARPAGWPHDGVVGSKPDSALNGKGAVTHATTRMSPAGTTLSEIGQAGTDGCRVVPGSRHPG